MEMDNNRPGGVIFKVDWAK